MLGVVNVEEGAEEGGAEFIEVMIAGVVTPGKSG